MNSFAPIVIFVYNRYNHTQNLLNSLEKCRLFDETPIYFYCDYAKKESAIENVNKTRKVVDDFINKHKSKDIIVSKAEKNKGLATSVIEGVTNVFKKYDSVIVLEDDLIVSENFLEYMNNALNYYKNNDKIWSISGFSMPMKSLEKYENDVYFTGRGCSWGWATWKNKWMKVDWDVLDYNVFKHSIIKRVSFGKWGIDMPSMLDKQISGYIDSWAIRWCYSEYKNNMLTVYPRFSLVKNNGCDGSGTNCGTIDRFKTELVDNNYNFSFVEPVSKRKIRKEFQNIQFVSTNKLITKKKMISYFLKNINLESLEIIYQIAKNKIK